MQEKSKASEITHIGDFQFHDEKVNVYLDPYLETEKVMISFRARNPDSFYQGLVFVSYVTGNATYPDDAVIPEQTARDREYIPIFVIVGSPSIIEDKMPEILTLIESEHKRRNGLE